VVDGRFWRFDGFLYNAGIPGRKSSMHKAVPWVMTVLVLGGCGLAVPAITGGKGLTPTGVTIGTAETALKRAAEAVCPPPADPGLTDPYQRGYESSETEFSFFCAPAAGHSVDATLS
jgi:hypothetical protein